MAKRQNGEGTIYFDEARQTYRAMITTPGGKRLTKSSKEEDQVKDWLNEQRLLVGRGQHLEPHGITLGDWLDEWLEVYAKPNVRPRTYDRYCSLLNHAETLRKTKLISLTPSHFQRLYNALETAGAAGHTRRKVHYALNAALKQAVTNNLIRVNPVSTIKAPAGDAQEVEIFDQAEIDRLLEASKLHRYPEIILIGYTSGARLSEILGLRWEDIDLKAGTIRFFQSVQKGLETGVIIGELKTKSSKRKITVPAETIQALRELKMRSKEKTGLIFLTERGTPLHSGHYLRYIYDRVRIVAKTEKGFHALRHTHASMLLAAGVPIQDVSRRLGHARVSTTLDIYGHCLPAADERASEVMSGLMKKKKASGDAGGESHSDALRSP